MTLLEEISNLGHVLILAYIWNKSMGLIRAISYQCKQKKKKKKRVYFFPYAKVNIDLHI